MRLSPTSRSLAVSGALPVVAALLVSCSAGAPAADSSRVSTADGVEQGFDLEAFRVRQRAGHDRAYQEMSQGEIGSCWGGQDGGDPVEDADFTYRADCERLHRMEVAGIVSYQPQHRAEGGDYDEGELSALEELCRSQLGERSPYDEGDNHAGLVSAIAPTNEDWNAAVDSGQSIDVRCTWYYSPMRASATSE